MSVSAIFGTRLLAVPNPSTTPSFRLGNGGGSTKTAPLEHGLVIECSSRPQKKGTKHHMKTRPRKTQPWDVNRKPTVYAPIPPLPPDWTLVSAISDDAEAAAAAAPPLPLKTE